MDVKGVISIEYIILIGFTMGIIIMGASYIGKSNELNIAMSAARNGAIEGANVNSFAIYPESAFDDYMVRKPRLISQSSIKIIKIDYLDQGFNPTYKKRKIQLKIYASAPSVKGTGDRNSLGDRINFYVRKSICEAFGTQNQTNKLFNPAFSDNLLFTTADVQWV
ncbi:MAG: hypothetical protein FJ150_06180 [Euryarchaeota archaeon]|nr:hypothetical protein [Euryarchaeota archaeon]